MNLEKDALLSQVKVGSPFNNQHTNKQLVKAGTKIANNQKWTWLMKWTRPCVAKHLLSAKKTCLLTQITKEEMAGTLMITSPLCTRLASQWSNSESQVPVPLHWRIWFSAANLKWRSCQNQIQLLASRLLKLLASKKCFPSTYRIQKSQVRQAWRIRRRRWPRRITCMQTSSSTKICQLYPGASLTRTCAEHQIKAVSL